MMRIKLKAANEASAESLPTHIDIAYSSTVVDLKLKIKRATDVPVEEQKLVFKGQLLANHRSLTHYDVKDDDTVVFLRRTGEDTTGANEEEAVATEPRANSAAAQQGQFPFGGFGDPGSMLNNPELMRAVWDSPMFRSMMDNPELLRSILQSSPEMQAVLESQPHLNHVLNDPQLWRQQMEAIRNPAMMQEMLRNQDRALSNIESLPGGYNALRRMYHDVHEPMMSAAGSAARGRNGDDNDSEEGDIPPSSGPHSAPLPNPWGRSSTPRQGARQNQPRRQNPGMPMLPPFNQLFGAHTSNPPANRNFSSGAPSFTSESHSDINPWAGAAGSSSASTKEVKPQANPWESSETSSESFSTTKEAEANPWASSTTSRSDFAEQLNLLADMGFTDRRVNVAVLNRCNGNVDAAIDMLTSESDQQKSSD